MFPLGLVGVLEYAAWYLLDAGYEETRKWWPERMLKECMVRVHDKEVEWKQALKRLVDISHFIATFMSMIATTFARRESSAQNHPLKTHMFWPPAAFLSQLPDHSVTHFTIAINPARLILFGLSIGRPSARSQINCASGPSPLLTPNVTV